VNANAGALDRSPAAERREVSIATLVKPQRGLMRSDIIPGAVFPDYELADHTGKHRKLSELQGQNPMALILSRGGYCPKDRRQAEGLVQLHR
jgi:hypothetical protein